MYENLSEGLLKKIKSNMSDECLKNDLSIRRNENRDRANLWRPCFVRDVEKILYCPYYNRYSDKTQVFSFYKNDDISRRALHVQLVSRIARNIGRILGLNLDLIEAISIGHDIGHTPFGHIGESVLNEIYNSRTNRYFFHNLQSVRVLDKIFNYNISLQTLNGILCHNGETELSEYKPHPMNDFSVFDEMVERCCNIKDESLLLVPSTLEGCVVRICDIIAYLGKDRQDAQIAKIIDKDTKFKNEDNINFNAVMINNLTVNIIENSYGKDYISLSDKYFNYLKTWKKNNYEYIYMNDSLKKLRDVITPMFEKIYSKCILDLDNKNTNSVIYRHHINYIKERTAYYENNNYMNSEKNQIVVDYLASMTDDYFTELYDYLFPATSNIKYISYFKKDKI